MSERTSDRVRPLAEGMHSNVGRCRVRQFVRNQEGNRRRRKSKRRGGRGRTRDLLKRCRGRRSMASSSSTPHRFEGVGMKFRSNKGFILAWSGLRRLQVWGARDPRWTFSAVTWNCAPALCLTHLQELLVFGADLVRCARREQHSRYVPNALAGALGLLLPWTSISPTRQGALGPARRPGALDKDEEDHRLPTR